MTSKEIRKDFPIFNDNKISYLDSAATSQKPKCVIDEVKKYYEEVNSNPHRGTYSLSMEATNRYEEARQKVADFIGCDDSSLIIFSKNATESLNLVANSYGLDNVNEDDEIVISIMEHHSNLVPWQNVARIKKAKLNYLYINDKYEITEDEIKSKITSNTKIVAITYVSNVLGVIVDVKEIIDYAHSQGAVVVLDASQSISHMKLDVKQLDADFVIFSGHKMFSPMGVGVLYGKRQLLNKMRPFLMGGDMIEYVYEQDATFAKLPNKFEAGTQNVGAVIGLGKAVDYMQQLGYETISNIEKELMDYMVMKLSNLDFITMYLPADISKHTSVLSFNIKGIHPHDVSSILDSFNVCIRAGNHCAQPLLRHLGLDSTCRASISIYNTKEDIDKLAEALQATYDKFKKYLK